MRTNELASLAGVHPEALRHYLRRDLLAEPARAADGGPDSCDRMRALAADKIADLIQRIADLRPLEDGLTSLVATCNRPPPERECSILHELGHADELRR